MILMKKKDGGQFDKWGKKISCFVVDYREYFYYFFVLSIYGLMSIGKGSGDYIYRMIFPISMLCLLIKFFSTKYTYREWFWMILIGGMLLLTILINGERALFLSFMAVVGAKDINYERLFKIALWERVALTAIVMALSSVGVIQNISFDSLPKYINGEWKYFTLYTYGYKHPNHAYWVLFTIAILFIMVYRKQIKWFHYVILNIGMCVAYRFIVCRAGWYTWLASMFILLAYELIMGTSFKRGYMYLVSTIPIIMTLISVIGVMFYGTKGRLEYYMDILNRCFTGRFELAQGCKANLFKGFIGNISRMGGDLGYIHFIYNYGWFLFVILMLVYLRTMWKLIRMDEDYLCIGMSVMSGYLLGEVMPLSAGWNISIILVSIILFKGNSLNGEKE